MNPILQNLQKTNPTNVDSLFQNMMNNNPKFRNFVHQAEGKSVEQIAKENGININVLQALMNTK